MGHVVSRSLQRTVARKGKDVVRDFLDFAISAGPGRFSASRNKFTSSPRLSLYCEHPSFHRSTLEEAEPLVSRGMPQFGEVDDRTVAAIAHYLRSRAREVAAAQKPVKVLDDKGQ